MNISIYCCYTAEPHADKAYDSADPRAALRQRGIERIERQGAAAGGGSPLGAPVFGAASERDDSVPPRFTR